MSARTVSLGGMIWASAAHTTIPTTPIAGEPYRNTAFSVADAANGWKYYRIVNSADFNQFDYLMSTVLNEVEQQGLLKWSNLTDYPVGGLARDPDDGYVYEAIIASGPNSGGTRQPSLNIGTYWKIPDFLTIGGYKTVFVSSDYSSDVMQQVYCLSGALTVILPTVNLQNGDKVKVTTNGTVSTENLVTVSGSEIEESGTTAIEISTPRCSVEFIWNASQNRWKLGDICYPQNLTKNE